MEIPKDLNRLVALLEGQVDISDKRFYRQAKYPLELDDTNFYQIRMETVGSICIHIPEHRIKEFNDLISDRFFENYQIRKENIAVQKAYEKYQMLLELVRNNHA